MEVLDTTRLRDDGPYREEVAHRCITDHFFLAEMMGFRKFDRVLHKPAVELYFPKNPNVPIEQQDPIHFRMHLDPRNTFKTTLGRVDTMQWLLAFPETITILNESATQPLARAISGGVANYFWQGKGQAASLLQLIYPYLVCDLEPFPEKKDNTKWNAPTRKYDPSDIDSTMGCTSPLSTQSGWHPYIICPDDMVDTKNSGIKADPEVRRGVIDTYDQNENLLRAGGYVNIRGTRYHPFDLYGDLLEKMDPDMWKVLIRSTLTVKSGVRMQPGEFPDEEDCIMHFDALPGMDYKSMRAKFYKNYESFMCQQQNDPQGGNVAIYDEKLLQSMMIEPEKIPPIGETYCFWRFPVPMDKNRQEAEGICGRLFEGKAYVIDAWSGNYTPSRLAEKVVRELKRHQTNLVVAEDTPGAHYMEAHIRNEALRKNMSVKFQWNWGEEDENARQERMRQMEPQARAGKIWISTGTGKLPELRKQFINFGIVPESGILDCVSRMSRMTPWSLFRTEIEEDEKELQIRARQATMAHFVYGGQESGGRQELSDRDLRMREAHAAAMMRVDTGGLTDILGGLDG